MDETISRSLLVGLAEEGLEDLLTAFQPRAFQAGQAIITLGEEGDELFLLVAGKVRVWTGDGPATAERTLSVMGPGEHFGEASMISGRPRNATVTALTYVETLVLKREDYERLLPQNPQLLKNITRSLTRRLSEMNAIANRDTRPKRGIHSLAIVIETPAGWTLAQAIISQLRQQGRIIRPAIVSDGDMPMPLAEFDTDCNVIDPANLAVTIASRSDGKQLAVAVACGAASVAMATKECDRIVFALDANAGLDSPTGQTALSVPEHRRPIAALMLMRMPIVHR